MISYAQNFEDVMLQRVFKDVREGFYIDVGACDPVSHSVTKHFYDKGWHGINVEPSEENWKSFKRMRPRDINLNCAVSDHNQTIEFLELPNSGSSSVMPSVWNDISNQKDLAKTAIRRKVDCMTLKELCELHVSNQEIHFLKIDVEGAELLVIKGANFVDFRPKVIVSEALAPHTNIPNHHEWDKLLIDNNYTFAYFDGLNRYYVRNESDELLDKFHSPPNVFDDFTIHQNEGRVFKKTISIGKLKLTISY